jgi:hypothetical protein
MLENVLQEDLGTSASLIPRFPTRLDSPAQVWKEFSGWQEQGTASDSRAVWWWPPVEHITALSSWVGHINTEPSEIAGASPTFDVTEDRGNELDALVIAAGLGNEALFVRASTQIRWSQRPAADFVQAVHLALSAGAHVHARLLATQGAKLYPDHPELCKIAHILAPPRVVKTGMPPDPSLRANREWLRANRARYHGQWVALRDGRFLASANTIAEIRSQVSNLEGTLITRVS